jgi:hypothetical protein
MDLLHAGGLSRFFFNWLDYRVGAGSMAKQIVRNYYYEKNVDLLIRKAEQRIVELNILKEISAIDDRIKALEGIRYLYPPHNTGVDRE